jgi:hypothetical protein
MSDGQVIAMIFCAMLGAFPMIALVDGSVQSRRNVILLWLWFLAMAGPAVVTLWIKAVLG